MVTSIGEQLYRRSIVAGRIVQLGPEDG